MVLAGGSFSASAWETGLVAGLASAGIDLRNSDLFIGTSAGARVALNLAAGLDLERLFAQQFEPVHLGHSAGPTLDWPTIRRECAEAKAASGGTEVILKRIGAIALRHGSLEPSDVQARRETMRLQLASQTWPEKPVLIVTLNAETGARRALDRASGVSVIDAMIATTASFGAPPVPIDGQFHIDGGYHSSNNADLASGFDEVIVLSLRAPPGALALFPVDETVAAMKDSGVRVVLIQPDEASQQAVMSGGPGDPAVRGPIAKAAYQQGKQLTQLLSE